MALGDVVGGFEVHIVASVEDELFAIRGKRKQHSLAGFAFLFHLGGGNIGARKHDQRNCL
jgi:hypothetical protein